MVMEEIVNIPQQKDFVHLHLHTEYSLLDSTIRLKDLFARAKDLGMSAVAQTDFGNMFGAIDFYCQGKASGVKPILGAEVYFTEGSRHHRHDPKNIQALTCQDDGCARHEIFELVLLCKNKRGYENLCKIITQAYLEGLHYKPRIDSALLQEYSEGLICISPCLKGAPGFYLYQGRLDKAEKSITGLSEIFKDDFYLEVQRNGNPDFAKSSAATITYAKNNGIALVASNNCFYMAPEDAKAQEVLTCVQTKRTLIDEDRTKLGSNEFYFKSAEEMWDLFKDIPEACENTLKIAEKCNVELKWTDESGEQIYHLPIFPIETDESEAEYFRRLSREGLDKRFQGPHFAKLCQTAEWEKELKPQYLKRLEDELDMIIQMGFAGYFLIVSDFIVYSKKNNIPVGPGRGSGAGSIIAYALTITNINPLPFNLLFERFINPERISMPDFDIDFCQQKRQLVIDYVTQKYGEERVGQIVTFGKLQAKAALRDVSRVFSLPYTEADMLSKLVPDELGISLSKAIKIEPKFQEFMDTDPKIRQIIQIAQNVEGLSRHSSIHAAGVIITSKPLVSYCPLLIGSNGEQVVQFDKDFSEKIGLVKFDFLGLKTLTVIDYAAQFIKKNHDENFDIEEIDLEDAAVYDFISQGNTIGVFQLESSGMIDLCKRIMPGTLDDITAINALYRPGPLESGMVDDFIEIKHGRKDMEFPFEELAPVLKDTYGVIVYQEQVMNIARIVAGYSLGQADMLRRAMGKKKISEMDRHREIFCKGAQEKGFDVAKAKDLFELMANFAAYGFNKSHAVAYALIAYQTAFLKKYYCPEFFAGLLSTELNNTDKVTLYINDCKSYGIEILPPDVNESNWLFNVVAGKIRFALGAVKGIGEAAVEQIVKERLENGNFSGFLDFCLRVSLRIANKRTLEALIKVGAFDHCDQANRKNLLSNLEKIMNFASKRQKEREMGQVSLFEMTGALQETSLESLDLNMAEEFSDKEKLNYEHQLMGIYVSGHPLDVYKDIINKLVSIPINQVQELQAAPAMAGAGKEHGRGRNHANRRSLLLAGLLTGVRTIITKKGDKMCFAQLEDLSGTIEVIVFPKVYAEYAELLTKDDAILLEGYVNLEEEPRKFFPEKCKLLGEQAEGQVKSVSVKINLDALSSGRLHKFRQILLSYRGTVPTEVIFENNIGKALMVLGEDFLVNPTPQLAHKINEIFNAESVDYQVLGQHVE